MKKLLSAIFVLMGTFCFSQSFTYQLSGLSVISVAIDTADANRIKVIEHITTKIVGCPYAGKFESVDLNVPIYLNSNLSAKLINDSIPFYTQKWINKTYGGQ